MTMVGASRKNNGPTRPPVIIISHGPALLGAAANALLGFIKGTLTARAEPEIALKARGWWKAYEADEETTQKPRQL